MNGAARSAKRRMLIIVNPYATTVSDRLKNLVVYALQGRYDVEAVLTEAKDHATDIGREAVSGGYDVVCAFGGDGTLNEVANGLMGTDIPVTVLPGGSTNVVCRTLGIPNDVVDATEHLLRMADDFNPRRIDLGLVDGRAFVFSCGIGLDATVVERVDAHPRLKTRYGPWFYTYAALSGFTRQYLRNAPKLRVDSEGTSYEGVTAVFQNSDPFTYFRDRPVRVCEDVEFDSGTLSFAVLKRAAVWDMPGVMTRVLADSVRLRPVDHSQIDHAAGITEAQVTAISSEREGRLRDLPVQVDGDFIGRRTEFEVGIRPNSLMVVA